MEYQTFNSAGEVYEDFKGRRDGLLKALTVDVDKFYNQCDPERENLCLYGYADKTWEVNLPAEEVPPEIPEPALGINFARGGMQKSDWLQLVAMHSDTWLISVAFFNGSRLDAHQRAELFNMINGNSTLYEVVSGRAKPNAKPKIGRPAGSGAGKPAKKMQQSSAPKPKKQKQMEAAAEADGDDDFDDGEGDACPSCGGHYKVDEFWIACDGCETWYHGKCVKMSPQFAEKIKTWKCPSCTKKLKV